MYGTKTTFEIEDTLKPDTSFGCIMSYKTAFKNENKIARFKVYKSECDIDIHKYVRFLKNCTFLIHITNEESIGDDKIYTVELHPEDYINTGHFMAGFTAFRYCLKGYYPKIANAALDIKTEKPKIQSIKCFQLAHYKEMTGYFDGLHQSLRFVSTLVGKDEYLERITKLKDNNAFLKQQIDGKEREKILKIAKEDITKCFKMLNV